tara:strand:- start:2933 stop:3247 length:315 start_codon:yes stop_codon:yes gene_type:complete
MSVYDKTLRGVSEGRVNIPASGPAKADLTDWVLLTDTAAHPQTSAPMVVANLCGDESGSVIAGAAAQIVDLQWDSSGYWKFRVQLSGDINREEQVGYIAMSMFG